MVQYGLVMQWRDKETGLIQLATYECHSAERAAEIVNASFAQNEGRYDLVSIETH